MFFYMFEHPFFHGLSKRRQLTLSYQDRLNLRHLRSQVNAKCTTERCGQAFHLRLYPVPHLIYPSNLKLNW